MMQSSPIRIVHVHNGTGGGVFSVIRNLMAYRQHADIENHIIYTINRELTPDYKIPKLEGAASEQIFYYNPNWNFYYTCRQLAKLLPDDKAVIVAHDWLELGMVTNLGLNYPVVQFLHGDYEYYYQLAERHEKWIDSFVCVSASISENLKKRIPERSTDIHYLRFPVPEIKYAREESQTLQLVFIGRCEEAKGYHILPFIDVALQQKKIYAHWHIAGPGSDLQEAQFQWKNSQVSFYGNLSQPEITSLLLQSTVFVLPSYAEGMPVSIVEAMKAGVIPVVNDLKGGLQELIMNDVTGYLISDNSIALYAECLLKIASDPEKREKLSLSSMDFANKYFNPIKNTLLIEDIILHAFNYSKKKTAIKTIGSRLDQPWIPNFITNSIRSILK